MNTATLTVLNFGSLNIDGHQQGLKLSGCSFLGQIELIFGLGNNVVYKDHQMFWP